MKILQVIPYFGAEYGGPLANTLNIAANMNVRHIENAILTTKLANGVEEKIIERTINGQIVGVRVIFCPARIPMYRISRSFMHKFQKMAENFDGILIRGLWQFPCSYAAWWCRKNHIPYFIFTHAMLAKYSFGEKKWKKTVYFYLVEKKNLDGASGVFFMDSEEMGFAKELGFRGKCFLSFNGLNEEDIVKPSENSHGYQKDRNIFKVLFLGRIHPKKGLEYLVGAVSGLLDEYPGMRLMIAGPVDDEKYLKKIKQMTENYEQNGRICFVGMLTGESKKQFLASGDVFVLPSHDDSQSNALLEAMAAGLPVIITPGCKMPEVDGKMGYVVELSVEKIGTAIRSLIDNRSLACDMGSKARDYILENRMWPKKIDGLLDIIQKEISYFSCKGFPNVDENDN